MHSHIGLGSCAQYTATAIQLTNCGLKVLLCTCISIFYIYTISQLYRFGQSHSKWIPNIKPTISGSFKYHFLPTLSPFNDCRSENGTFMYMIATVPSL